MLELRPPIGAHKGTAVAHLLGERGLERALYAGDDTTDLDAFNALEGLELGVRVAVASPEGPAELARGRRHRGRRPRGAARAAEAPLGRCFERGCASGSGAAISSCRISTSAATTPASAIPGTDPEGELEPDVSACGTAVPAATSSSVREIAIVESSAIPTAPPICCDVLISPDARPASACATPASAAIVIGTKQSAMPSPMIRKPGKQIRRVRAVDRDLREQDAGRP